MSWGAHGVMGELKSPLGMMALAALFLLASGHLVLGVLAMVPWYDGFGCLVPFDLRSFGLGGPSHDAFCLEAVCCLVPVTSCHSVLGVPCFLLLFPFLVARPLSGLFAKVLRLRWWRVCPGFGWPSSGVAALWVLVARLSLSRMQ